MTTLWTISQTNYETSNGFIVTAHWICTATDGDYTASAYSTCSFPAGTPTTPYDQVTEQDVLNWIWNNGVDKDATEASLQSQIELQKHPVVAAGVPW